ncbi:MAG TPA: PQQ-binding-like beta-propeller repeat protein [Candidatus Acidoferrales bacterium]|jgi:quinoprotein glucose dehydrogenase|nr:PQQ-binding-like beta-propeller repeat protein [Candidatus Acidoferrales bacterium]
MSQTRWRKRRYFQTAFGLAAAFAAFVTTRAQSSPDKWWPGYGNGPDNSRYFASKQINKSNVNQLQVAWTYPYSDTGGYPIVARGAIYGRGRNGSLVAVDAKTGKELWIRENMNGMSTRGVMYWESRDGRDQRLIFPMNSLLQEIDAKTGKSVMAFGTNGVVDLRVGIDGRDPATIGNIQSNTPGEVFENLVIVGSATGEGYMSPPGDIRAYDVLTGKPAWTFHTVPRPGEYGHDTWPKDAYKYIGGVNNWGEMTVDPQSGIVYIPLGSPTYDFYGLDRIGANLFGTSVVALDARTGKRRWHFQFVHHDLWDMDPSAAPSLTTIRHNGRNRDVVALTSKTGWLYVLDRATGEPIWPIEERPFPKSEVPGEQSWPTQPVPTRPEPYIRHTFTVEDISPYLPAEEAAALKQRLLAATNKGVFTPINFSDTVHVPASNGGTLFGGTAAEPRTGAVYIISHDNPGILKLVRPGENAGRGGPFVSPGQLVYQKNCQMCHGADRLGTEAGVPLVHAADSPANNIVAGTSRVDASTIRATVATGKSRMPAMPHITGADLENLVTYLTGPPAGRGRGPGGFGRGGAPAASGAPPELIAGSGSAWNRREAAGGGRGRGAAPPYPEGVTQYDRPTINEYNTVGNRVKPPFTSIVKYDLNKPGIQWRIPYGNDPALAARGITGTGTPGTTNSLVVTESGLVFGAGGDSQVLAWDSETGKQLWSSRFGGSFLGSLVMYEMDGRQYLLVPAASSAGGRGRGGTPAAAPAPLAPLGWVAYALPAR